MKNKSCKDSMGGLKMDKRTGTIKNSVKKGAFT